MYRSQAAKGFRLFHMCWEEEEEPNEEVKVEGWMKLAK